MARLVALETKRDAPLWFRCARTVQFERTGEVAVVAQVMNTRYLGLSPLPTAKATVYLYDDGLWVHAKAEVQFRSTDRVAWAVAFVFPWVLGLMLASAWRWNLLPTAFTGLAIAGCGAVAARRMYRDRQQLFTDVQAALVRKAKRKPHA